LVAQSLAGELLVDDTISVYPHHGDLANKVLNDCTSIVDVFGIDCTEPPAPPDSSSLSLTDIESRKGARLKLFPILDVIEIGGYL
jgi:hypothetical protein